MDILTKWFTDLSVSNKLCLLNIELIQNTVTVTLNISSMSFSIKMEYAIKNIIKHIKTV